MILCKVATFQDLIQFFSLKLFIEKCIVKTFFFNQTICSLYCTNCNTNHQPDLPWWIRVASSLTNINCYSVKTNTNTVKSHFLALPKIDFVITHSNSWILFHLFHYQIKACEFVFCLVSNRLQFRKLFLQIKTSEMTNKIVSSLYLMWVIS